MPIEDSNVIDMVTKPAADKVKLIITDAGVITDREERMKLFVAKLRTYVGYVMSEKFRNEYPGIPPKDVTITLVTRNPPSEEMAAVTQVGPKGDAENRITVEFELFGGADGMLDSGSGGSGGTAPGAGRPWWKIWG